MTTRLEEELAAQVKGLEHLAKELSAENHRLRAVHNEMCNRAGGWEARFRTLDTAYENLLSERDHLVVDVEELTTKLQKLRKKRKARV